MSASTEERQGWSPVVDGYSSGPLEEVRDTDGAVVATVSLAWSVETGIRISIDSDDLKIGQAWELTNAIIRASENAGPDLETEA